MQEPRPQRGFGRAGSGANAAAALLCQEPSPRSGLLFLTRRMLEEMQDPFQCETRHSWPDNSIGNKLTLNPNFYGFCPEVAHWEKQQWGAGSPPLDSGQLPAARRRGGGARTVSAGAGSAKGANAP